MSSSVCVCRGCLATASECKLYDMRQHGLLTAYRQILQHTNSHVGDVDIHPYMCSYCTALLIKYSTFRDKCMRVRDLLEHVSLSNVEVTNECINVIDRMSNKLIIPLTIDRNVHVIDYTHVKELIKDEIKCTEQSFIKETDSDQEILSEVVNNKAVALVKHVKDGTGDIKIEIEPTEESFMKQSDSNQKIQREVAKGKPFAAIRGDMREKSNEIETRIKKRTEKNKKGKVNNNKIDPIGSKKNYRVGNKRHNTKNIKKLTNSKTIKSTKLRRVIKEVCTDSDIDDVLGSISEEEKEEENEKGNDKVNSYEKTDTEGTMTEIDTDSDVANVVDDYNEKPITKDKKKIVKERKKVIKKERQYKPRIDDETFSKQYYVDIIILTKEEQRADIEARKDSVNYKESPYQCETCFTGWNREETLNNHLQKHDEKTGQFVCDICGYRFKVSKWCRDHRLTHQFKLVCRLCGFVSRTRSKARWHHKMHMGHTFTCDLCGATHPSLSGHLSHLRLRHPAARTAACPQCGEVFLGAHGLAMHRVKTAGECRPVSRDVGHTSSGGAESGVKHECSACGLSFLSAASLDVHKRRVHEMLLPLNPTSDLKQPLKGLHICEVCGKRFQKTSMLRIHLMVHKGVYPFQCTLCPKGFSSKSMLKIHSRVHSGERPYRCAECGLAFSVKCNYNRHKTVHSGEKRFKCDICDKRFTQSSSVKLHVRTVHMKEPAPPRRRGRRDAPAEGQLGGNGDEDPAAKDHRRESATRKLRRDGNHRRFRN